MNLKFSAERSIAVFLMLSYGAFLSKGIPESYRMLMKPGPESTFQYHIPACISGLSKDAEHFLVCEISI